MKEEAGRHRKETTGVRASKGGVEGVWESKKDEGRTRKISAQ